MQWTDEAIILGTKRHGETSLIVELMTAAHGRHLGLVKGGRRRLSLLQAGNSVLASWRARLGDHLGNWALEPLRERAGRLMEGAAGLYAMQMLAELLRFLPDRDPHPALYETLAAILDGLDQVEGAAELMVRFELAMLSELGFGLDLSACAATGERDNLVFVSPKSGRAVGRVSGEKYASLLLPLPAFLAASARRAAPGSEEIVQAFGLTGFFLGRYLYEPRGMQFGAARAGLIGLLQRAEAAE